MDTPSKHLGRLSAVATGRRPLAMLAILVAALAAGCMLQPERSSVASASPPAAPWTVHTSTMRWNDYACDVIARNQVGQFPAARTLAYVNLAINNAIIVARQQGRRPEGAISGAAATTLVALFPKEEEAIGQRLAGEMAAMGIDGQAEFAAGVNVGRAVATVVIATAKTDRSDLVYVGPLPTGADRWSSRAQPPRPPLGPRLGEMRTFFLASGADYRAPPPPGYDSPAFRATLAEVRTISDRRSVEQLRIAQYWEGLSGSFNAGYWNEVTKRAIVAHGLGDAESARVLALVHMVAVDATIACHDSKYVYWVPRPTQLDPGIHLAIAIPNHPSYPSNHACISGAIGLVLDAQFPDEGGRYFAMAREAGESRIYGGIHYRIDVDEGFVIARKVAARALATGVPVDRPFVPIGS
ncbi:MAG TPA: phosphatase PAP2 family protein [Casimicrobiaceae bacterium]|nr:phosphatase PAP2 family protein [Casimicrobiaceae bacterium]